MNSDERQLITGLFDRIRGAGQIDKDRDAEALITQAVRQMPDAPYMLVQSVLVQEHALQQAGGRIEELESRVRELEAQAARPAPQQQSSGGFLGGLFGGGSKPAQPAPFARGAVPAMGSGRPMGPPGGSPWGQPAQQGYGGAPMQQAPAAGGGGSFMKSAMATAAGVAGGMLLANSISGMLGGSSGNAHAASATPQTADNSSYDPNATTAADATRDAAYQDPNQYEADNYEEAGYDDGGDAGGEMDI